MTDSSRGSARPGAERPDELLEAPLALTGSTFEVAPMLMDDETLAA